LNISLTEVFSAIKGDPAFRWPPKMKTDPFRRDRSKFCEYHADHGHSTEDCMSLHREIETFIQNGKLVKFLRRKGFGKQISKDVSKEVEKVSAMLNQDVETRL
jgi:hypothetical protein